MPNLTVPLNTGLDNFSDAEEVGINGNVKLENVYIGTPGKIIQRPYADNITEIPNVQILKIHRWANPDLPFSGFGWVCIIIDSEYNEQNGLDPLQKIIRIYNRDFSQYTNVSEISVNPTKIEILENVALFTMGIQEDSLRYRYHNKTFFDKLHSFQGWHLDIGRPINTFATIKSVASGAGGGKLENNKYFFYKVVPIFDGLQVSELPNNYVFAQSTQANDKMVLQLQIDLLNLNPRCNSIDIYRATGTSELEEDLNYYKIKSISTIQPLGQTGAIADLSQISMNIADNGSFYDSTASADYNPDDWMCILQPQTTTEPLLTSATTSVASMVRLFNQTQGTTEYPASRRNNDVAPTQYATGDLLPVNIANDDEDLNWYDWTNYVTQNTYTKDVYPFIGFSHTQSSTNDNATDTALLGAKIRETSHNSAGDKNWIMLKRNNLVKNGHFMGDDTFTDWNRGVPSSLSSGTPNINNYHGGGQAYYDTSNYTIQGGYDSGHHIYQRPQLVINHQVGNYRGSCAYANSSGSVVNNSLRQQIDLEEGKTYWFQYSFQWGISNSNSTNQNGQKVFIKLTKPNGAYPNLTNYHWTSRDADDAIHYKEFNRHTRHGFPTGTLAYVAQNYEKGWYNYAQTFTVGTGEGGTYTFNLWMHSDVTYAGGGLGYHSGCVRLKDVGIFEVDTRANYYAGNKVIIPKDFKNSDPDVPANPAISDNDYQGGNVFVGDTKIGIDTNYNTIFELEQNMPSNLLGTSPEVLITKGLNSSLANENGREVINLEFNDIGYTSVLKHQTHETPINVKYQFSQYIEGRMFVANCRYTNEQYDDVEQDSNLVLFSELNQPNVIPVTNYIKCQDNQGGNITGLGELMGNLVVFLEDSIWRINVPSTDPQSWSLIESSKELGCTSSSSIMSYEDGLFFANKEGLWGLSQNFMPKELSRMWRDHYQANYDDHTLIHYCPKSHMLYVNQNNPYETWVLDVNNEKQQANWLKLVDKGLGSEMSGYSGFMNDETSKPFFFENRVDKCVIGELEPKKGNQKSGMTKRTGWVRLNDLNTNSMVRRVNLRYKANADISDTGIFPDLNIYVDGKETIAYTKKGDDLFLDKSGEEAIASLRCGVRCKYFSLEFANEGTEDYITDIDNFFEILSIEIEWE